MATSVAPPADSDRSTSSAGALAPASGRSEPSSTALEPLLDARWALNGRQVAACAWFCLLFLYYNYIPLFHSDLWGHVHYGKWMLETGRLVVEDPFMPFAKGMTSANNAWLAQVCMAQLHAWGGPYALSNLFAVVVVAAHLLYARTFYLLSGRLAFAVLGSALLLAVGWSRHAIIRPEIFGNLFFALLLWLLVSGGDRTTRRGPRESSDDERADRADGFGWRLWLGVPALFALWVNAHGTFAVGLVTLACHLVCVTLEEAWETKSLKGLCQSRRFQRWAVLTQLAFAACLLNPYGIDMLIETWQFGKNPNLKDVLEWYPLKLIDMEGLQFGLSAVLLLIAARWSRRPVRPVELLLLTVFVASMAPTIRMIAWYAPIFVYVWTPHAADAWRRIEARLRRIDWSWLGLQPDAAEGVEAIGTSAATAEGVERTAGVAESGSGAREGEPSGSEVVEPAGWGGKSPALRFAGTLLAGLMIWTTFAFSPISHAVLGGKTRPLNRVYSRGTPLRTTEYLREHPQEGVLFGPQWWGDWLAWDGPPGTQVFMTTHVHLAPKTVWKDYLRVARGLTGWSSTLERYSVRRLVVDRTLQPALEAAVRGQTEWTIVYEDEQALIAERKSPEGASPAAKSAATASVGSRS